ARPPPPGITSPPPAPATGGTPIPPINRSQRLVGKEPAGSAEPDLDSMCHAVVDQRHPCGLGRDRGAVDLDAHDAPRDAVRVLDTHLVAGGVIAKRDREAAPRPRDARVDEERRAA